MDGGSGGLGGLITGSLPDPMAAASSQIGDMAEVAGITSSSARARLEELRALDRRCYTIAAQDEVWQAYRAEIAAGRASDEVPPPVGNPWNEENRAFHAENCTEERQAGRRAEMRALRL